MVGPGVVGVAIVGLVLLASCGADDKRLSSEPGDSAANGTAVSTAGTTSTPARLATAAGVDTPRTSVTETVGTSSEEDPSCPAEPMRSRTIEDLLDGFTASLAPEGSEQFVRLTDVRITNGFQRAVDALLADDADAARCELELLRAHGVRYEVETLTHDRTTTPLHGAREVVAPGHPDYKGWGVIVTRPGTAGSLVYQGRHPGADLFSDEIAVEGFLNDDDAPILMLAGTHLSASGRRRRRR